MDDPQRSYLFGKSKKVCITIKSGWHIANFSKKFTQKMTELKFLCGILKLSHDKSLCDVSSKAQSCLVCKLFLFHFLGVCVHVWCVCVCVCVCVCLSVCVYEPFSHSSMFDGLGWQIKNLQHQVYKLYQFVLPLESSEQKNQNSMVGSYQFITQPYHAYCVLTTFQRAQTKL